MEKYCTENSVGNDTPQKFFTELFNKREPHKFLVSAESPIAYALNMDYQHITHHWSLEKFFKRLFNLRPPFLKFSFDWDVQIMFDHFIQIGDNLQMSDKQLSRNF